MVRLIENNGIENSNNKVVVYDNLIDALTSVMNDYKADCYVRFYAEQAGKPKRISGCELSKLTFGDIVTALSVSGHANNIASAKCRITTFPYDEDLDDEMVVTII